MAGLQAGPLGFLRFPLCHPDRNGRCSRRANTGHEAEGSWQHYKDKPGRRPALPCGEWIALVRGCGLFLCDDGFDVQAEGFGYAFAVGRVGFVEVLDLEFLDAPRDAIAEAAGNIVDEALFRVGWH